MNGTYYHGSTVIYYHYDELEASYVPPMMVVKSGIQSTTTQPVLPKKVRNGHNWNDRVISKDKCWMCLSYPPFYEYDIQQLTWEVNACIWLNADAFIVDIDAASAVNLICLFDLSCCCCFWEPFLLRELENDLLAGLGWSCLPFA